ncbi:hypothetical protein B5X24_HaOG209840 [Helicoverpa armigera]|nr:hypothetical protein B5X24_HaOG209840 [Helicoverpa armigera]
MERRASLSKFPQKLPKGLYTPKPLMPAAQPGGPTRRAYFVHSCRRLAPARASRRGSMPMPTFAASQPQHAQLLVAGGSLLAASIRSGIVVALPPANAGKAGGLHSAARRSETRRHVWMRQEYLAITRTPHATAVVPPALPPAKSFGLDILKPPG